MDKKWARLLAYVTGLVNQELLLQNEYLMAENCILKAHLQPGFRLTDGERTTLAEIGKRLGPKALQKVSGIAKPASCLVPQAHRSQVRRSEDFANLYGLYGGWSRGRRPALACRVWNM